MPSQLSDGASGHALSGGSKNAQEKRGLGSVGGFIAVWMVAVNEPERNGYEVQFTLFLTLLKVHGTEA